jgi:hypothetical protein
MVGPGSLADDGRLPPMRHMLKCNTTSHYTALACLFIAGGFATVKATIALALVTSPLSGRQHNFSKLAATALGHYKLMVPLAPLGCHEASAPARTSDHLPPSSNLGFPPIHSPLRREHRVVDRRP